MDYLEAENKSLIYETGRSSWWQSTIKNTPLPGAYNFHDLVHELNSKPIIMTYGFKSSGRKRNADPSRKGEILMPGIYKTKSFVDEQKAKKISYNFKSTNRNNINAVYIGIQDKAILKSDIGPTKYAKDFKMDIRSPSTNSSFKSQSVRFPTIHFKPKSGPSPNQYENKQDKPIAISSPFKSKTPRFKKVHVLKTPGPGTYAKLIQYPMPKHILDVGRYHGVFFPPGTKS